MANEIKIELDNFQQGRMVRIHPAWHYFIKYCESLGFGEIEKLKIHDGLPMLAEEVKKKIKFSGKVWG
jgi:hypothetical protein